MNNSPDVETIKLSKKEIYQLIIEHANEKFTTPEIREETGENINTKKVVSINIEEGTSVGDIDDLYVHILYRNWHSTQMEKNNDNRYHTGCTRKSNRMYIE